MAVADIEIKYELPEYSQSSVQPTSGDRGKSDKPEVAQAEENAVEQSSSEESETEKEQETIACTYCPAVFQQRSRLIQHHKTSHKRSHPCSLCDKSFSSGDHLARHLRVHTGEKPFNCTQCELRFADTSALRVHSRRRHSSVKDTSKASGRFRCEICMKCFSAKASLRIHELLHPENESNETVQRNAKFVCTFCGRKYNHKRDHERHVGTHTKEKPYSCTICQKGFLEKNHLERHQIVHQPKIYKTRPETKPSPAPAEIPLQSIKTETADSANIDTQLQQEQDSGLPNPTQPLQPDLKTPTKRYSCEACSNKSFDTKWSWEVHLRTHTGERPYKCETCGKRFCDDSTLRRHEKIHTGEISKTSYSYCDICKKSYSRRGIKSHNLRLHSGNVQDQDPEIRCPCAYCGKECFDTTRLARHIAIHTGEKVFACHNCDQTFRCKHHLTRHQIVHMPGKPESNSKQKGKRSYECTYCSRKYTRPEHLNTHIRTHTGERPYACNVCPKKFYHKIALDRHVKDHTGQRPFPCTSCDKAFKYKQNLATHVRRFHSNEKGVSEISIACSFCEKTYKNRTSVLYHEMKIHPLLSIKAVAEGI